MPILVGIGKYISASRMTWSRSGQMDPLALVDYLLDIFVIAIMSYVGLRVIVSSSHVLRDEELRQLKYLWLPTIVGGGFLYILNCANILSDYFDLVPDSLVGSVLNIIQIVVSLVYTLGMYRFSKFVEDYEKKKEQAKQITQETLEEMAKRLDPKESN